MVLSEEVRRELDEHEVPLRVTPESKENLLMVGIMFVDKTRKEVGVLAQNIDTGHLELITPHRRFIVEIVLSPPQPVIDREEVAILGED